jgi:hypothetical protein
VVLVCGGRNYNDAHQVNSVLEEIHRAAGIRRIVHGGATGADTLAGKWAAMNRIGSRVYHADWKTDGPSAGPKRNATMLASEMPDLVVAFPGGRGTEDMVRKSIWAGVPVRMVAPR